MSGYELENGNLDIDDEALEAFFDCAQGIMQLREEAYRAFKPLAGDLCTRVASQQEVERLLDAMLDFTYHDGTLELFRAVCRHYPPYYPSMVRDYVYLYRDLP